MIVSKTDKIILITPPKTGTHSITKYLKESISSESSPVIKVQYPVYHLTLSEICYVFNIKLEDLKNYKIIQCVRNPYARASSSYFHQIELKAMNLTFKQLLEKVKDLKYLLPYNLDEFYIKFYGDINYKYSCFINNHWGGARFYYEQSWFNDLKVDNVAYFKLEDLSINPEPLSSFLGIQNTKFPYINKNERSINYKEVYDTNSVAIVKELYYNDLKQFNYEF